jgi:putative spermidine/putrescine transport system ATP-binding protein
MRHALRIEELTVRYADVTVLDRVNLEVRPGEFLTLLGPSGSGKTSLLMAIAGFATVTGGAIRFGTTELSALPPHRRGLGIVFQSYALFPHLNVFDNVAYPLRLRKVEREQIDKRVHEALALMKMEQFASRAVQELSGGQRQRVALARAMVFEPAILLMDEPLSALDRKLREHMQLEIRRLHERLGITTVYVTHDQREALTMSDRIVVMDHGRIVQIDTPRNLYERPNTRFVADFIGVSSFIPVRISGQRACFGVHRWSLQGCASPEAMEEGAERLLSLRPESVHLLENPDSSFNALPAVLRSAAFEGDAIFIEAELHGGVVLRARVPVALTSRIPAAGTEVLLGWRPENSVIVAESAE